MDKAEKIAALLNEANSANIKSNELNNLIEQYFVENNSDEDITDEEEPEDVNFNNLDVDIELGENYYINCENELSGVVMDTENDIHNSILDFGNFIPDSDKEMDEIIINFKGCVCEKKMYEVINNDATH